MNKIYEITFNNQSSSTSNDKYELWCYMLKNTQKFNDGDIIYYKSNYYFWNHNRITLIKDKCIITENIDIDNYAEIMPKFNYAFKIDSNYSIRDHLLICNNLSIFFYKKYIMIFNNIINYEVLKILLKGRSFYKIYNAKLKNPLISDILDKNNIEWTSKTILYFIKN